MWGLKVELSFTATEFAWTKLSLELIQEVKGKLPELEKDKKDLIAEAEITATALHATIAFVLLGSPDKYVDRLCEKYHGRLSGTMSIIDFKPKY